MTPPEWTLNVQPHQWPTLHGTAVEIWLHGRLYRRGLVDAVMPDESGLWLAADGSDSREFISISAGDEIRACLPASAMPR
jgi:hypothetical protein